MLERRRHKRFGLKAPVLFLWKDAHGKRRRGRGITRDISLHGTFVLTKEFPPIGTKVRLTVHFRDHAMLKMRAEGQTIRVQPSGPVRTERGFAATTKLWRAYREPFA